MKKKILIIISFIVLITLLIYVAIKVNNSNQENLINNFEEIIKENEKELKDDILRQGLLPEGNQTILDYSSVKPLSSFKDEIYFMVAYELNGPIFAFNINSSEIRRIESFDYNEPFVLSLDKTKAISLSDYPSNSLYLIDFTSNSKEKIIELEEGKTFEYYIREMDAYFNIEWLDNDSLKASVYEEESAEYIGGRKNTLSEVIYIDLNKNGNNVNLEIGQEDNDSQVVPSKYFTSEVNKIKILKNEEKSEISTNAYLEQTWPMVEKVLNAKIDNYNFFDNTENFENFLKEITKDKKEIVVREGYFDINNPTQKIIVASAFSPGETFVFIMNESFEMNILRYDSSHKPSFYFENNPIRILNDLQVFILKEHYAGGTCGSAITREYFFYISDLKLLSALSINSNLIEEDEKPLQYDYPTDCSYRSDFSSENYYVDIDGDNIKEIIVTRFKAPFEGNEDIIKEFWRFIGNDIYRWNSAIKIFEKITKEKNFLYRATEFVSDKDFPFFEFWTEAYCPNSVKEPQYNFQIPFGYNLVECIEGEKGSHNGCPTCAMSKIILEKVKEPDF